MTSRVQSRCFRGRILTPVPAPDTLVPPLRFIDDGALVVGEDGTILRVEPFSPGEHGFALDLRPRVIVPGFVDAHLHFPQTRVIGSATGPLLDWLAQSIFPEEARFVDETYARDVAAEFFGTMLSFGTTCAGIYATSSKVATRVALSLSASIGMVAQVGLVLMDRGAPRGLVVSRKRALADLAELANDYPASGDVRLAVTPRFALSCSRALLAAAAAFADKNQLLVQTHLSENKNECEQTISAFPGATDYLGVYEAAGLAGRRSLFAHAIHLSESEWDRIARAGSRIVHCPDSNAFLGSGRMRLAEALRRDIPTGLGSDIAAGRTFDMRKIAASAYDTALAERDPVSPEALFSLATWGGANVLGVADRTGALTPGRRADFVVIDLPPYARSFGDVLRLMLFATDTTKVFRTYLRGAPAQSFT